MPEQMTRRAMLTRAAGAAATAVTTSHWIFALNDQGEIVRAATKNGKWSPDFFSKKEIVQITLLCETIIPKTDTVGAQEARVHEYIDLIYSIASKDSQNRFRNGLKWMDKHCKKTQKTSIAKAKPEELIALLETVSDEHESHPEKLEIGVAFFRDLKGRTITGYYTSKEGRVEELGLPEHTMMTTFEGCTHSGDTH
ncbi:MAG: gluconate 2-dehydrogenase subunit 3 family protein [Candidatus Hydrogenedentota bacterium]